MPSKPSPITMDAVYTAPGYLFRRMQQIAVSIFVEECSAFDLTPVQYAALVAIHRTRPAGDDGVIAGLTYLDVVAAPASADPEVQKLLIRQQALSEQIDELRRRRPTISAEEFDREFEKLIVDLSLVSRDIRRKKSS